MLLAANHGVYEPQKLELTVKDPIENDNKELTKEELLEKKKAIEQQLAAIRALPNKKA
jgi:hypothetical protein